MILRFVGAALLSTAALASPSMLKAQAAQGRPAAAKAFDIAGVTVTMPVPEAVARLRQAGWTVTRSPGHGWEQHVRNEILRQHGQMIDNARQPELGGVSATKGDERLSIAVRPSPRGGQVETVGYYAPLAGRAMSEIARSLDARYGKPSSGHANPQQISVKWCDPTAGCRSGKPYVTAETRATEGRLVINLFWGADNHLAWDRMVAVAVAAKVGPAKASF